MSKIDVKPIKVQLNGKETGVRGLYHIAESTTMVSALDLAKMLGGFQVKGLGDAINIITDVKVKEEKPYLPLKGRRIAVSAPHKKNANQSPIIKSYYEGNVMFYTAKLLAEKLRALGATVLLVRDDINDVYTLAERGKEINAFKPDLCLEAHTDASGTASTRGVHVIRQIARSDESFPLDVAKRVSANTGIPMKSDPVWTRKLNSTSKFDWYYMLREILCESLIIECGYHTNKQDIQILTKPEFPELVAKAIADAVVAKYKS